MILLDGKKVRDQRVPELRREIRELGFAPVLGIVQIGRLERSEAYVIQKIRFGELIGARIEQVRLSADVSTEDVLFEIRRLNADPAVNGVIIQLPLPQGIDRRVVIEAIDPTKDVDGLTARNLKSLLENDHQGFLPATTKGVLSLLRHYEVPIEGREVVVVGRSLLVGKSTALAFLNENATVTICHRFTRDLPEVTKRGDILVVATGSPLLITPEHVHKGQVVVDVGINVSNKESLAEEISAPKLIGDVDFVRVKDQVLAISPVPGGVGPMTVLSLFENLIEAARRHGASAR
ncbi:MAG: hypothetical protein A2664_04695 [Candidatus Taylorbacteria bacterium RIFCSPHIGHO2_01_FULL_46_22b]|uniref:Bifunctional protein FolD n=1 Tax=Candidatus Taylorbacteria bacterium RIFCSPHIGHO2_01_FULL_46_22b TaxID=1802301 RepID=A0A1G2M4H9_9BACT|nr:MAG: hypothetical protein A2664_04695 [Candidatus Taylorbacteria bacterium RIFCSPHIGHO2_01_FULL_46_22b]